MTKVDTEWSGYEMVAIDLVYAMTKNEHGNLGQKKYMCVSGFRLKKTRYGRSE